MGMLAFVGIYDPCLYLAGQLEQETDALAALATAAAAAGGGEGGQPAAAAGGGGVPPGLMSINVICAMVR